jgi:glycosidase
MPHRRAPVVALLVTIAALLAGAPASAAPGDPDARALTGPSLRAPETDEHFYFVMADRFENGDRTNDRGGLEGDRSQTGYDPEHRAYYHGGDLQGLRSRLEYIRGLGTTAVWLTPSFKNKPVQAVGTPNESAGYHGYWITDFTQIDPHLGTNAELAGLIADAHALGMKVYFDIITNHTADVIKYEPDNESYISKDERPYLTAAGQPFDDREYAGTDTFPPLDPATSFPRRPVFPTPEDATVKTPNWLNDPTLYHNRGNTDFVGEDEDSTYGDFFGLDDLFTEHPTVVEGMKDIYKAWIRDFDIDGFRIDTVKHVNDEFWQDFAPDVLEYARSQGKPEFFMFGEVFATSPPFLSKFPTRDKLQAVLDFPFQEATKRYVAENRPATVLRDLFLQDDWYTDEDSNVYQLPTFLGNHDMGRIGHFIQRANGDADSDAVVHRDRLAHELMYFSRGNPVIYYGDEQGFVGDGGDQLARQDMFPSLVDEYNDDDLIATEATTAQSNFDTAHPLYRSIARLAETAQEHRALRNGAHQHRYAAEGRGIYAFSRILRDEQREYVVAVNNAETAQTAEIPTYFTRHRQAFQRVYGTSQARLRTAVTGRLRVTVPPLSTVVYRSTRAIPRSSRAPLITLRAPASGGQVRDRAEVRASVPGSSFYEVTFWAKVGEGDWQRIGTDDTAPYRVFHDVAGLAPGTKVQYRAAVLDNRRHARSSGVRTATVAQPAITLSTPAAGGRVGPSVPLEAAINPDNAFHVVRFQRSLDAGATWTDVGAPDTSAPQYRTTDDVSGLAPGTVVHYRAVLQDGFGSGTVTSAAVRVTVKPPPDPNLKTATIHYQRPDGQYANWGLHLFGDGLAPGQATAEWTRPTPFEGTDAYGAVITIDLADATKRVGFIVHGMPPNENTKDTDADRFFVPADTPEIWLRQGDPTIYDAPPA